MANSAKKLMRVPQIKNLIHVLFRNIRATFASFASDNSFTLIEPCLPCLPAGRRQGRSSFTLIELLIVIGILAILVAAVVIALNPAQLLAQARDGKRQQDLSALTQALNTIYALDQSVSFGSSSVVYTSLPDSTTTCANWHLPSLPSGWIYNCVSTSSLQSATGTGWIPVNFTTTGVVSLASLPIDPINTSSTGLYYTYVTGGSYELTAAMESSQYKLGGDNDAVSTDGGLYPDLYEVGSNLSLSPIDYGDIALVGYWKFDETTGTTAYDSSGNNNNGIMYSSTTPTYILTSANCKSGNCGNFDGAGRYVNAGSGADLNMASTNAFSIAMWVKPNSLSANAYLIDKQQSGFKGYFIWHYTTGKISIGYPNGSAWNELQSVRNLLVGNWTHIVATQNGNQQQIYIDGTLDQSRNQSINLSDSSASLHIGNFSNSMFFNGFIDNVRVYNRALSASEISALYSATK